MKKLKRRANSRHADEDEDKGVMHMTVMNACIIARGPSFCLIVCPCFSASFPSRDLSIS